jgi:hypothetical protein
MGYHVTLTPPTLTLQYTQQHYTTHITLSTKITQIQTKPKILLDGEEKGFRSSNEKESAFENEIEVIESEEVNESESESASESVNANSKVFEWQSFLFRISHTKAPKQLLGKAHINGETGGILLHSIHSPSQPPTKTPTQEESEWVIVHELPLHLQSYLYEFVEECGVKDEMGRAVAMMLRELHVESQAKQLQALHRFFL